MDKFNSQPPSRLARRLGTFDAVAIGLGSMIGAGVFSAVGPAAKAAGSWMLVGLALAAGVAYCNAMSSSSLAALYPKAGGTYIYGRKRLGKPWGFLAGWGFVIGKLASCAAMALTFGHYLFPAAPKASALAAIAAVTALNGSGVGKTSGAAKTIVALVLACLLSVVAALWSRLPLRGGGLVLEAAPSTHGILQSAGFLFFAFAGYARIATLGEEVKDPVRTIPKAIPLALGITLLVYALVSLSALRAAGPHLLGNSPAPLKAALEAVGQGGLGWLVGLGAGIASFGVLLSLVAGLSRTVFSMAAEGDLPGWLDAVHPRHKIPHRAGWAVGGLVAGLAMLAGLRAAIGFSSFCVLAYYLITNASAWTLGGQGRLRAGLGMLGCLALGLALPLNSVLPGLAILALGAAVFALRKARN